ncbi:MAG: hypothetical protein ACPG08_03075, partial [Flavobacteriales bacterium]
WASCKQVLLGGGRAPMDWLKGTQDGPVVYEGFGMTETISHFAVRQLHPKHEEAFECLPGFAVSVDDHNALRVAGPDGRILQTNDAADVRSAKSFRWLGRLDDVINSGGIKIHPAAVEQALASVIDGPFTCYGESHPQWGQALVLRIHAAAEPADAGEQRKRITAWARTNLLQHHAPKRIEWLPLETTASGKWKRPRT